MVPLRRGDATEPRRIMAPLVVYFKFAAQFCTFSPMSLPTPSIVWHPVTTMAPTAIQIASSRMVRSVGIPRCAVCSTWLQQLAYQTPVRARQAGKAIEQVGIAAKRQAKFAKRRQCPSLTLSGKNYKTTTRTIAGKSVASEICPMGAVGTVLAGCIDQRIRHPAGRST